jgi:hypothetical protein
MSRREFPALNLDDVPDGIKELERAARLGHGVNNMMRGSDYPYSGSTFHRWPSLARVPDDEQVKAAARTTIRGSPAATPSTILMWRA